MNHHFVSVVKPPTEDRASKYWLIFRGSDLLVREENGKTLLPFLADEDQLPLSLRRRQYLGFIDQEVPIHVFTAEVTLETAAPVGMAFKGLRQLYGRLADDDLWLGGRAIQIIDWDRNHIYCGRCGASNESIEYERAKKCPNCDLVSYPRISPAIIVRITRPGPDGEEILLARGHGYRPGFYSVLAGFVEPGETLETAVHREIREEVGLKVKNVTYFGSQPWPFPNSLMIAYTADYMSGEIQLEEEEIEDAQWFTSQNMPNIPPRMSISRALIDDYMNRTKKVETKVV